MGERWVRSEESGPGCQDPSTLTSIETQIPTCALCSWAHAGCCFLLIANLRPLQATGDSMLITLACYGFPGNVLLARSFCLDTSWSHLQYCIRGNSGSCWCPRLYLHFGVHSPFLSGTPTQGVYELYLPSTYTSVDIIWGELFIRNGSIIFWSKLFVTSKLVFRNISEVLLI